MSFLAYEICVGNVQRVIIFKEFTKIIIEADLYYLVVDEFSRAITAEKNYYNSLLIG